MLLFVPLVLAAPPSARLAGSKGALSWTVTPAASGVTIVGRSPEWVVEHEAGPDLAPRRTTRKDTDGSSYTIVYTPAGADVTADGKTTAVAAPGAWDGDTLDVRLGTAVAAGRTDFQFVAVDGESVKAYTFQVSKVGDEQCGAQRCVHEKVTLTGALRWVGPTWEFWYAPDGRLLRFSGPMGDFAADGAR